MYQQRKITTDVIFLIQETDLFEVYIYSDLFSARGL